MIRYALRCDQGHDFEGWFRSSSAYDTMRGAGQVACAHCGSAEVQKSLMAPSVGVQTAAEDRSLSQPQTPVETALHELRKQVEANSDYVGLQFADQARAMHEGRSEPRAIHGEARPEDARKLLEDGVAVTPLPFLPRQKVN